MPRNHNRRHQLLVARDRSRIHLHDRNRSQREYGAKSTRDRQAASNRGGMQRVLHISQRKHGREQLYRHRRVRQISGLSTFVQVTTNPTKNFGTDLLALFRFYM